MASGAIDKSSLTSQLMVSVFLSPFNLRHESLSKLGDLGLSSSEIKKFSGHKHSDSLDRYVHLDEITLAKKLQRLLIT